MEDCESGLRQDASQSPAGGAVEQSGVSKVASVSISANLISPLIDLAALIIEIVREIRELLRRRKEK